MVKPDDTSISDDSSFLRALIREDWWVQMEDRIRPSSAAFFSFNGEPGETSCYIDTVAGREIYERRFPGRPAARFGAGRARAAGFNITRDPEGDGEQRPEHMVLTFSGSARRKPYHLACRQLALDSTFVSAESLAEERRIDSLEQTRADHN